MSLARATRSEVTKQFSTSIWWILALVLVVYVAMMAGGMAFLIAADADGLLSGGEAMPLFADASSLLYSFASSLGFVFALLIGTLMVTTEYRHQTLTPTFLAVPGRGKALLAKMLVAILLGGLYGLLALLAAVGPSAGALAAFDQETALGESDTWAMFGRVLIALVLWTLLGVGVGVLVRNQVAAVVGVIAFTQFVEPMVRLAASFVDGADKVAAFLPGASSDALVGASFYNLMTPPGGFSLDWWVGGIVLGAYAALFLLLGYLFSWRRDVS